MVHRNDLTLMPLKVISEIMDAVFRIKEIFQRRMFANLDLSYAIEDGLVGKYLVVIPQMSKSNILHRNFCMSKKVLAKSLTAL